MVTVPEANTLQGVTGTADCQHGFQFETLSHSLLPRLPWGHASSGVSSQLECVSDKTWVSRFSFKLFLKKWIWKKHNANHMKRSQNIGKTRESSKLAVHYFEMNLWYSSAGRLNYTGLATTITTSPFPPLLSFFFIFYLPCSFTICSLP